MPQRVADFAEIEVGFSYISSRIVGNKVGVKDTTKFIVQSPKIRHRCKYDRQNS